MTLKDFVSNLFGFTQEIYSPSGQRFSDLLGVSETNLLNNKNNLDLTQKQLTEVQAQFNLLKQQQNIINQVLPEHFHLATDTYKSGFWIFYKDKDNKDLSVWVNDKIANAHLTLTPIFKKIIDASSIKITDTELQVFNKILAWVQNNTTYCYDQNQWGSTHGENWTPAIIVYGTRKDDCESVAGLVISAFQYWQILTNRKQSYAFIGVGLYAKSYGHGFPCLWTGINLMEDLFIGEATLSAARDAKQLKNCKDMYWINWGAHSFWHEFRINPEGEWWNESTATPINGSEKMTGTEIEDALVQNEKQFKKKKKAIEDFWKIN